MNERFLQKSLLRVVGTVELGAFVAVVMPWEWMAAGHSWIGLGEMPEGAIVSFMIRQASFTYGLHGVAMWVLSWDVVRFRPLIVLTGISYVVAAPVFVVIDVISGMPWFWTVGDGGSCLLVGAALLWLDWRGQKRRRSDISQST